MSICLMVQDNQCKMTNLKIKLTIDQGVAELSNVQQEYYSWLQALKKTQRPMWVDPDIESCFICERPFSIFSRRHHCRKCGTVVCKTCSNQKCSLPELAYTELVRVCNNCYEGIRFKRTRNYSRSRV